MQEEHVGREGGQDLLGQTPLGGGAVLDRRIHDGMATTFGEHEQADLRKRSRPVLIAGAGKSGSIGSGIGYILHRPIQGHQPLAEAVGASGRRRTQRSTTACKESLQGGKAQLPSAVADGRASHLHGAEREAHQVQGACEPLQDAREGQSRPQSGAQ